MVITGLGKLNWIVCARRVVRGGVIGPEGRISDRSGVARSGSIESKTRT
jgi:hypothetical protein